MAAPEIDGYRDLTRVGQGGFATVYRARQDRLRRWVALKVLDVKVTDEDALARFDRECAAVGELSWHPNVIPIYDSGVTPAGQPWLAMEYLEDGSLADRLASDGPMSWWDATEATIQVAGALGAAHAVETFHRDLKPENLLVGHFGEVVLADFGIAAIADGTLTAPGQASFTVNHVAPEVLRGHRADERSDVYGLASTLHTLLTGTPPLAGPPGEPIASTMMRIIEARAPRLTGTPPTLADLVERALEKDPALRPPSAEAFGQGLQAVQAAHGRPVTELRVRRSRESSPDDGDVTVTLGATSRASSPAPPPPTPSPPAPPSEAGPAPPTPRPTHLGPDGLVPREPPRPRRRRRWILGTISALALAIVIAVVAGILLGPTIDRARDEEPALEVEATIPLGASPLSIAFDGDTAWVTNNLDGTVSRLSVRRDEVVETIEVGDTPVWVEVADGAAWVSNFQGERVDRIDVASGEVAASIPLDGQVEGLAATDDAVWVANLENDTVVRVDPATDEVAATIDVEGGPVRAAATDDAVWVTSREGGTLTRIDPVTDDVVATIDVGRAPVAVSASDEAVWVTSHEAGLITRVDPATNTVVDTFELDQQPTGVDASGDDLFVATATDQRLNRLDPASGEVLDSVEVGVNPADVEIRGDLVWVTNYDDDTVSRVGFG